jgi:DNA-directed RNA polymerase alpha subunit
MSSIRKIPKVPEIPDKAKLAIQKGVEEEHHVCLMEELGLTQRMLNLFEDHGITHLKDLMGKKKEDLLDLPNFGDKQLILLFDCLSRYDKLPEF